MDNGYKQYVTEKVSDYVTKPTVATDLALHGCYSSFNAQSVMEDRNWY